MQVILLGPGRRIMPPMTRALPRANWIGPPSLCQLWLETLLRVAAMLGSNVAAAFRMIPSRHARDLSIEARRAQMECDTQPAPQALPGKTHDTLEESNPAAERSEIQEAFMRSSPQACAPSGSGPLVRVSREGGNPVLLRKKARAALRTLSEPLGSRLSLTLREGRGVRHWWCC